MAGTDTSVGISGMSEENVVVERGRDSLPPPRENKGVEQNLQTLDDHVLKELESLKSAVGAQDELRASEYVKEFTTLMFHILNMAEDDLLFNFVDDLQSWANKKLQRRGMKDVDEAISMAESLTQYDRGGDSPKANEVQKASEGNHANGGGGSPKAWHKRGNHTSMSKSKGHGKLKEKRAKNKPKDKFSTGKGQASTSKRLLYMEAKLNGKPAQVLVDTGVTHNFITMDEVERMGLNVVDGGGWLKTVNTGAKPLQGTVQRVEMSLGKWKGLVNFSVAQMDDFKAVLGLDFLRQVNALVSPYNNAMSRREEAKESEGTYLASLKVVEDHVAALVEPQKEVRDVLKGKKDIVPREFKKRRPPKRNVDDQHKLDQGAKLKSMAPCGMVPQKLEASIAMSETKGRNLWAKQVAKSRNEKASLVCKQDKAEKHAMRQPRD
ncbi:hypothetical protein RJ640_016793 [Escallonia rubra]|uniref:Uncharacterized protein n=1 Tax=Escallonia rubra TaxID=112253 RepID=A0AA88RCC9_9ASTE|nr:hypothetical protein RJ640_016793 [Escallonia rubra]